MIKAFSTFSGIGGFDLALERQGIKIMGHSEIDKFAEKIYQTKFNNPNYGDITKIKAKEMPDFDILVGGFPCQAFSIAGKRGGFADTRGSLFFDLARILQIKKPRYFLFENVKGLLSHDRGKTFATVAQTIAKLGYSFEWQVLNSKNFGVPQNRERVFIIGYFGTLPKRKIFPLTKIGAISDKADRGKQKSRKRICSTIDARYGSLRNSGETYIKQINKPKHSNNRVYDPKGVSPSLNTMQGGMRQPKILTDSNIRKLTPLECERLQAFPDNWTQFGIDEQGKQVFISDTQRYKTLGNAVTVSVVEYIIKKLL